MFLRATNADAFCTIERNFKSPANGWNNCAVTDCTISTNATGTVRRGKYPSNMKVINGDVFFASRQGETMSGVLPSQEYAMGRHHTLLRRSQPKRVSAPLYCSLFTIQQSSGVSYIRRVNQNILTMEYIVKGSRRFRSGNLAFEAEAGDMVLTLPGMTHELLTLETDNCVHYGIIIQGTMLISLLNMFDFHARNVVHVRMQDVKPIFHEIYHAMGIHPDECDYPRLAGALFRMLSFLDSIHEGNDNMSKLARRVKQYLDINFMNNISMSQLAREIGRSHPTINKAFQASMHLTPAQYLQSIRLNHARNLLPRTDLLIKEVALLSGFSNLIYFSACFREKYHCTPSEYRASVSK